MRYRLEFVNAYTYTHSVREIVDSAIDKPFYDDSDNNIIIDFTINRDHAALASVTSAI